MNQVLITIENTNKLIDTPKDFDALLEVIQNMNSEESEIMLISYTDRKSKIYIENDRDYGIFMKLKEENNKKSVNLNVEIISEKNNFIEKNSSSKNSAVVNEVFHDDDLERNPKFNEKGYSKASYNKSNLKRIYYIKIKKDMDKQDQIKYQQENSILLDEGKKIKKKGKMKNTY